MVVGARYPPVTATASQPTTTSSRWRSTQSVQRPIVVPPAEHQAPDALPESTLSGVDLPDDAVEDATVPAWVRQDPAGLTAYLLARAGNAMTAAFARRLATVGLR